jgi:AraC family transcriptional regulator
MTPEIRELPDTKVLYARKAGAYDQAASEAWSTLMGFAYKNRLMSADTQTIGIGNANPAITPADLLRYDACITFDGTVQPEGDISIQTIAGGRYAVFLHKGAYTGLSELYRSIFAEWLPTSGCTLRDCRCFEKYLNRDPRRTKPENLRTEIWIPLV